MKSLILAFMLIAAAAQAQKPDPDIYVRDIFNVVMRDAKPPIRGWTLKWDLLTEFAGSIDFDEYVITASRPHAPTHYFHVSIKTGVENDTDQSVYEVRVKEVKHVGEDWSHNQYWDAGEWSGEKGKSKHWVPSGDDKNVGVCSNGGNWLGTSIWPTTKEECFKSREEKP